MLFFESLNDRLKLFMDGLLNSSVCEFEYNVKVTLINTNVDQKFVNILFVTSELFFGFFQQPGCFWASILDTFDSFYFVQYSVFLLIKFSDPSIVRSRPIHSLSTSVV